MAQGTKAAGTEQKRRGLTKEQAKAVRELVEDGGYSRAEAIAWVLAFGAGS